MSTSKIVYADNAATTSLAPEALEAMLPFLGSSFANASQPYSFSRDAKKALKQARETIAACINAEPDEIYFTSGGSESDNWAIKGCLEYNDYRAIVTSSFEHHAVLNSCAWAERFGYPVIYLQPSHDGFITPQILKENLPESTKLVSVMMVNNEIGTIQPVHDLCEIAHAHGALFHTDAVQALGHIEVDAKKLGVDMLSCSAHKFNGPKGIGFLYVKKGTLLKPFLNGGAQEKGMRAGTENVASIVGMAKALALNTENLHSNQMHLNRLEQVIISELRHAGIDFHRHGVAPQIPGNLSLAFPGFEGEALQHRLDLMGIMVSTGSACDSKNTQISHVLKAIGSDPQYARGTIRISLGIHNTVDEAIQIVAALKKIVFRT